MHAELMRVNMYWAQCPVLSRSTIGSKTNRHNQLSEPGDQSRYMSQLHTCQLQLEVPVVPVGLRLRRFQCNAIARNRQSRGRGRGLQEIFHVENFN